MRSGKGPRRRRAGPYSAGETAWCLLVVCDAAIRLRSAGWCLGSPRAEEIAVEGRRLIFTALGHRRAQQRWTARRHATHLRRAHDQACELLGVSRPVVTRLVATWCESGENPLLMEAFDAALSDLAAEGRAPGWTPLRAREALAHAVRVRITPRMPAERYHRAAHRHGQTGKGRGFTEEAPGP